MFADDQLVDRIVQEVLREIAARQTPAGASTKTSGEKPSGESVKTTIETAISLSGKVVTEAILAEAGAAGRLVILKPGSVLTPSGRDFIRRNGVRISSSAGVASTTKSGTGVKLETTRGRIFQVGRCTAAAALAGILRWELSVFESESAAAQEAVQKVGESPILIAGGNASLMTCLLNRHTDVRAAVWVRPDSVASTNAGMNPNIVCCDCIGWSISDLTNAARQLSPGMRVPAGWKELVAVKGKVEEAVR